MFRDPLLQTKLERDGYVLVDFFSREEMARLLAIFERLHDFPVEGMFFSNRSPDEAYKARVQEVMREFYVPKVEALFSEADWIDGVFIVKAPGAGEFGTHQDWSLVDERHHRSVGIWAPLLDTDAANGTFCVLPGSHRFFETYRSPTIPSIYVQDDLEPVIQRHRRVLSVRQGQAVVFDHALVHATTPNASARPRAAAFVGIKPRPAPMRFYWRDGERIEAFAIEPSFLYRYDYVSRPAAESLGHLDYALPRLAPTELEARIADHRRSLPGWWGRRRERKAGILA